MREQAWTEVQTEAKHEAWWPERGAEQDSAREAALAVLAFSFSQTAYLICPLFVSHSLCKPG